MNTSELIMPSLLQIPNTRYPLQRGRLRGVSMGSDLRAARIQSILQNWTNFVKQGRFCV